MLKILPQLFYQNPEIKKLLVDGLSCIVHKKLDEPVIHKEGYVSVHAIILVLKGQLKVENDTGFLATIPENKMVFLPKGLYLVSDIIPDKRNFEALVFFFDEELITHFINSISLQCKKKDKCVTHFVMDYTADLKVFTETLLQLYGGGKNGARELTRIKLLEFLHLIIRAQQTNCFSTVLATLNNKERKSLHAFMNANFSKPLGIEDYAYLTGRSLSTFRRDFIAQFGISPKQWLIEKRLDKAYELLSRNHTTVSQVAMETGYENISHFVKAFHHRYGLPPKQFLMRKRKEVLV
jgi:AraC family transcriptional regulator, exoenzyme S synthesis regulatory protein ExsA